jgi:Ca-activated chloride channel family protein
MQEVLQFQLLRPWWFLGLLPVAWLLWKAWQVKNQQDAWHQVIAPQFRRLLLGENRAGESSILNKSSIWGLGFIWFLAILALSGPSLKSVQLPAEKNQQGTVILLDLSLSMLADDLAPNRLSRVKYKITDLVKQHPELSIGLVGYAGSAHSISPISEDNQTLLGLLPALNPEIMPSYGSNPLLGFEEAKKLLEGAFINHGHIIWITDDLEATQQSAIREWIKSHDYTVSIMPVGTATGGVVQIPNYGLLKDENGKIVLPPLPMGRFIQLNELTGVTVTPLRIGDDSVKALLPPTSVSRDKKGSDDKVGNKPTDSTILNALDEGALLLILLLPLVAFLYRRGWIFSLSFTMMLPLGLLGVAGSLMPTPSVAATELPNFTDAFKSPNQQGYQAWSDQNYNAAEALFEDSQWRASALYRLGKYAEAAPLFAKDESAKGFYNQGNALAKSGQLEPAKKAYENALKKQPDFAVAKKNLGLVTQLLQQQKEEKSKQKSQPKKSDSEQDNSSSEDQKNQQRKPENSDKSGGQNSSQANSSEQAKQVGDSSKDSASDLSDTSDIAKSKKANEALNKSTPESKTPADSKNGKDANDPKPSRGTADSATEFEDDKALPGLADSDLSEQKPNGLPQVNPTQAAKGETPPTEEQQATRNWLKQIPDEPGVFLKRKFEYQYQQQSAQPAAQSSNKQW